MKYIPSYQQFITEKKEEDFEDKIKDHGYYKGISTSTARKKAAQMKKQADMPDDDPAAYQPLPGDTKGKKLLKKSKHTKDYEELYKDESVNESDVTKSTNRKGDVDGLIVMHNDKEYRVMYSADFGISSTVMPYGIIMPGDDTVSFLSKDKKAKSIWKLLKPKVDKFLRESLNESKAAGDRSPIDSKEIETALKKKSEETGVPVPLLRIVMRRGMAAWKSGHRPGAGQEQWGYARLNSFLTKAPGTWGRPLDDPKKGGPRGSYGADADVAQEVIKGGHDKKLKEA